MRTILLSLLLWSLWSAAYARPDFLVDAGWLAEHIGDENLVVLEVRYHPHRYDTVGHIPGAVQVQRFEDLGDNHTVPLMRFPSHEVFQQRLRGWGVNDDSNIVLYDDSRTALTSRVYFMLELYGFHMARVQILDGGTLEWSAFNDLEKDPVERQPGRVTLKPANPDFLVELGRRADPAGRRGR